MKDLKHPAKPLFQNESDVDVTILSNEESDEEDYHMVTGANRQIQRQNSRHHNFLHDTTGSHAIQNTSTSTEKQLVPNNQIAKRIEKLGKKNSQTIFFHPKITTLPPSSVHKTVGEPSGTTHWSKKEKF